MLHMHSSVCAEHDNINVSRFTLVVDLSVAVLVGRPEQCLGVGHGDAAAAGEVGQGGAQFAGVDEAVAVDVEDFERRPQPLLGVT